MTIYQTTPRNKHRVERFYQQVIDKIERKGKPHGNITFAPRMKVGNDWMFFDFGMGCEAYFESLFKSAGMTVDRIDGQDRVRYKVVW